MCSRTCRASDCLKWKRIPPSTAIPSTNGGTEPGISGKTGMILSCSKTNRPANHPAFLINCQIISRKYSSSTRLQRQYIYLHLPVSPSPVSLPFRHLIFTVPDKSLNRLFCRLQMKLQSQHPVIINKAPVLYAALDAIHRDREEVQMCLHASESGEFRGHIFEQIHHPCLRCQIHRKPSPSSPGKILPQEHRRSTAPRQIPAHSFHLQFFL